MTNIYLDIFKLKHLAVLNIFKGTTIIFSYFKTIKSDFV